MPAKTKRDPKTPRRKLNPKPPKPRTTPEGMTTTAWKKARAEQKEITL